MFQVSSKYVRQTFSGKGREQSLGQHPGIPPGCLFTPITLQQMRENLGWPRLTWTRVPLRLVPSSAGTSPAGTPNWLGCPPLTPSVLFSPKRPEQREDRNHFFTELENPAHERWLSWGEGSICVSPLHPNWFLNLVAKEVPRTCQLSWDTSFTSPEPEPNSISPTSGESWSPEPSPFLSGESLGTWEFLPLQEAPWKIFSRFSHGKDIFPLLEPRLPALRSPLPVFLYAALISF